MAYYNTYMPQSNGFNNQFMGQPMQIAQQMPQQMQNQRTEQFSQNQNLYNGQFSLQGKSVDSIDVVKAMDIPLDGTISYFPLTDGSAIITKQLKQDGTSKTTIYKPINEKEIINKTNYITEEDFNKAISKLNFNDNKDEFKNEIKILKRQIKDLSEDIKEINDELKERKD